MSTESRDHRRRIRQWVLVIAGVLLLIIALIRAMNGAGLEFWMVGFPIVWLSFIPDLVNARWQRQRDAQRATATNATPSASVHPGSHTTN
jgi:hypothetical protein